MKPVKLFINFNLHCSSLIVWNKWSPWSHEGAVGMYRRKMMMKDPECFAYHEYQEKLCKCKLMRSSDILLHILHAFVPRSSVQPSLSEQCQRYTTSSDNQGNE